MRAFIAVLAVTLGIAAAAAADTQAALKRPTYIEAQSLDHALQALANAREMALVYRTELVSAIQTSGVKGELTLDEALRQLLAGTGLTYRYIDAQTITIFPTQPLSMRDERDADAQRVMQESAAPAKQMAVLDAARPPAGPMRLARTQDQENKQGAAAAKAEAQSPRLDEVIVTARKRTENLQDVPISIAVVSAEDIDRRGLVGASDYLRGIPGANQVEGAPGQTITVRGIEVNTIFQGFRGGETTGTYFGETPTIGAAGLLGSNVDIKLVDIERVEVLRGPQGTAFGGASMGGTVRTIPVAPKVDRFEGRFGTGYSATSGSGGENYLFQGIGNIPLIRDKLAIRATAYVFSDSGYYNNRAGSDPAFQTTVVQALGAQGFAADEDEVGAYYVSGGRIAALFQASDALRFTVSYLSQKNETDGIPVATSGSYEQTVLRVAPEHVRRGQSAGVLDYSIDIGNAMMEYDLGWGDLLATYSHIEGESDYMRPYTSIGFNWAVSQLNESPHKGDVAEVRLATKLDGAWNFLAGLYGEKGEDDYHVETIWFGDLSRSLFPAAGRNFGESLEHRELEQKAAFGEVSWQFLPGFTLTGGVRAFSYERRQKSLALVPGQFVVAPPPPPVNADDSGTTFRANLSYKPAENALLYAGWSQGFRMGGPQGGLPATACDLDGDGVVDGTSITIASTRRIDPDEVDNYELGAKFAAFGRRLTVDAAVFRMDWTGLPVSQLIRSPALPLCLTGFSVNAGEARSEGFELQASFQATEALRADIGGSYVHARLTRDVPAQGFRAGARLPGTPKTNANIGLQYGFNIGGHEAYVRADAIYIGSFFGDLLESPVTEAGDYVKVDATARLMLNNLNLDLFVRNLTDEDAFTFRGAYNFATLGTFDGPYGYQLRPRTVGLQLTYTF